MVSACLSAWLLTKDALWQTNATRIFAWFLGSNDLGVPLVDQDSGSRCDGLHPDRPNGNRGSESVLAYLGSLAKIRKLSLNAGEAPKLRANGGFSSKLLPFSNVEVGIKQ